MVTTSGTEQTPQVHWTDITPQEAAERKLDLSKDLTITAPLNENGERCPWPWEPQQLAGAPLGQYRCGYCMAMVVAGMPHLDYSPQEYVLTADNAEEIAERIGECLTSKITEEKTVFVFDTPAGQVRAVPGDTIRVDGFGDISVVPAGEPR
jgi:hypothetical protein